MMVRKAVVALLGAALLVVSGLSFYRSRHLREPLVAGPSVIRVLTLGDYFSGVKGTTNDAHIYVLEGREPGGTILLLGGTHPEEPAGRLACWIFAENATVERGRLLVIPTANRSASTVTRLGGAYPPDFTIPTAWGGQPFRMGDRWSNPLDQWPDPEVYIHYPTRQELAYVDVRNLNRTFPGRPDGTLTERTSFAIMELIRKEKVDIAIDLHEAELQYPVISTIVAHEKGQELAALASMMTSASEGFSIGVEYSPPGLHGLSHREIGDHSDAISLLLEAPEPFLDATRGRTNRALLLTGRDEFVRRAGERGLLFEKIDANGWPVDVRVGRHLSTLLQIFEVWSGEKPERAVAVSGVPRYEEIIARGTGAFLKDPKAAPPARVNYE
ncbi:MAG: succinylglutamate desuccinylase/aspartoacylase family protein [Candidatus Aminicenantes bacterium]|nr:succinylglutamate desuccinylase/aspartoacylase family protein [Candidatus Aminicenantes bacterium]